METNQYFNTSSYTEHIAELYNIIRKLSIYFAVFCLFWSFQISEIMNIWIDLIPMSNGTYENLAIYGPYEWLNLRWSLILLISLVTTLPLLSILLYRFSRPGLYSNERTWFMLVLILCTTIVPLIIILLWLYGFPIIFELSDSTVNSENIGIRYDAAALFSIALGITWILVIWSFTIIILGLARLMGLSEVGETRFRYRILAISTGTLILTIPSEYDGLRIILSVLTIFLADRISQAIPILSNKTDFVFGNSNNM